MRRPSLWRPILLLAGGLLGLFFSDPGLLHARGLSFQDRVRAQEAIERVYYSHQIGVTKPFEEAVPREVLEKKVRTYLKQSLALERFWNTPVTATMLQAEMERMERGSRMPGRLRELHDALGNDPVVLQECLARPILVARLTRNFFAQDRAINLDARRSAAAIRQALVAGQIDPRSKHPRRAAVTIVRRDRREGTTEPRPGRPAVEGRPQGTVRIELHPEEFEAWRAQLPNTVGEIGRVLEARESFSVPVLLDQTTTELSVASFVVPKPAWDDWWIRTAPSLDESRVGIVASEQISMPVTKRAVSSERNPGEEVLRLGHEASLLTAAGCVEDDTWDNASFDEFHEPRTGHTAVWTGTWMIVWGGFGNAGGLFNGGARYDPATDTWTSISNVNGPGGRGANTAVWTGDRMIVWGGFNWTNTGGRYDPVTDTWAATTTVNAPAGREYHSAVWTGTRMIIWGGSGPATGHDHDTGGVYDPETDTWIQTSMVNAPAARYAHTAVWTGSRMIVWGGRNCLGGCSYFTTGGLYEPTTNTWSPTSTLNAPEGRYAQTAVWTGGHMIVWGGGNSSEYLNTGGRYDPISDAWTPTSVVNAPTPRAAPALWTGDRMFVWGGTDGFSRFDDGAVYAPTDDTWTPITMTNAPAARRGHTAIWTSDQVVVWGGYGTGFRNYLNSGGRYDPATDTWTPTATIDTPTGRAYHTAVWTGSLMVVWGGYTVSNSRLGSGGRYDPATDSWSPTATVNAPTPRFEHVALWTGDRMVVWGGSILGTGGRYEPVSDSWMPMSTVNAPAPRSLHTAVWTGESIIVWGGAGDGYIALGTGARYFPSIDSWTPVSTTDAPTSRYYHTAVWTGKVMLVWGGDASSNMGGVYYPENDMWSPTSTLGAPVARFQHTAVWTGSEMVVWGGYYCVSFECYNTDTGGRYSPATDSWSRTSTTNAPLLAEQTAIWTGHQMLVWGAIRLGGRYEPATDSWDAISTVNAPGRRFGHTAVWTGSEMLVWGGEGAAYYASGGRYCACPGSVTMYFQDTDGDGYGNASISVPSCNQPVGFVPDGSDCNDAAGTVWSTPTDVQNLQFSDVTTLSWAAAAEPGGTMPVYDLLRSSEPADFGTAATCIETDSPGTTSNDTDLPAVGSVFTYLPRAETDCPGGGQGSLGSSSDGTPRTGRSCP